LIQKVRKNQLSTGFLLLSIKDLFLSPRSLEACRRQGIDPRELLIRTPAEIKEIFRSKNLDKEGIEQMVLHYEERRREKVRVLLEVN